MTIPRGFIYPSRVTSNSSISRQHIAFAIAGIIFGFLLGFISAHQVYSGRLGGAASANAPETMGGQRGAPVMAEQQPSAMGGSPAQGGGADGGGPSMAQMEQVKKELAALKQAVDEDPRNVTALARLGNMYMDAGMFDKSIDYYRRALAVQPDNVDIRTDMGTCLREMGKVQEALQVFRESITRDPGHWKSWFNIGIVYLYNLDDYAKAEEAFSKAHDLNPKDIDMSAVRAEIEKIKQEKAGKTAGSRPS